MIENPNVFDPVLLSYEDCDFLLAHAGEAPIVAARSLPKECNRTALEWVQRFYELEELSRAGKASWKGVEAVKAAINTYIRVRKEWSDAEKLGAPPLPSLYAFDSRGKAHYQAPGSDSGRVRTYFGPKGERIPFAINLVTDGVQGWVPDWVANQPKVTDSVIEDTEKCTISCSICSKTETYRAESRSSRAAARARISKHLRNAETEKERHSELHTLEFNS